MVKITGTNRVNARLGRLTGSRAQREIGAALYAGGNLIEIEAEISITQGSSSGASHVASTPGESPNRDSGILDGNIETVQISHSKVHVSSNAPYALALELGTSKMEERPYMRPAAAKKRSAVVELVRRVVRAQARGK